jgi:hypothetical protein
MSKLIPSLYCVTVIDSKDISVGNSCLIDKANITSFAKKLSDFLNFTFVPISVENKNYSVQGLRRAISSIDADNNDVVLFIYSGHGFSYREDDIHPYPQLALWEGDAETIAALRENSINMEEVFNLVVAKGARLNIVFSDCCNTFVELPRYEDNKVSPVARPISWNQQLATQLFIEAKGSYLISAASKGQFAACNTREGGYFTSSFLKEIQSAIIIGNTAPGWQTIITTTANLAKQRSSNSMCGDSLCNQDAIFKAVE